MDKRESKKQKVLIVHNYYQIPGGEDTVVANEKKMLEEHGHEVILYSRHNSEIKNMSNFQKLKLPFTTIFNLKAYNELKALVREEHIDIVHVHNTLNLISPSIYYAVLKCHIPVVQTIHNFRLLCPGATFYRDGEICEDCVDKGLNCAFRHGCYRNSKLQTLVCMISMKFHRLLGIYGKLNYICLTKFNKQKLLQFKQINSEKVYVKPNFVEINNVFIPLNQREDQFIFAGRLDKLKGIDILLEAWSMIGESAPKLLLCGIGPMEEWCQNYISKNNLNIEMLGFISNEDVCNLISRSKALILPTQWYEGFPMSIVEAFSVGTPVITSDLGNAGCVVTEGITGCKFKAKSAADLVKAVRRLSEYKNIFETTFEEYKNKYTQEINYNILMNIYREIA